jgi:broad-specificity NMP kinase
MSMLATNPKNRELFKRLADQLAIEALELEQVVKKQTAHLGSDDQHNGVDFNVRSVRERGQGQPIS